MATALERLNQRGDTGAGLQFPNNLGTDQAKHYTLFKIYKTDPKNLPELDFSLGSGGSNLSSITLKRPYVKDPEMIALYMPATVTNVQNAAYGNVEMGNVIAAAQALGSASDQNNLLGGTGSFIAQLAQQNLKKGGSEARSIVGAYEIQSGRIANNRTELIFENIDRRTFTFDFKMIPKTQTEALMIRQIVKSFRYHMAPSFDQNSITNRTMIVPSLFEIEFKPNTSAYLPKIGLSVCSSCNVTYGGARPQFYDDGSPVETSMTITFQEIELITKERIDQGY